MICALNRGTYSYDTFGDCSSFFTLFKIRIIMQNLRSRQSRRNSVCFNPAEIHSRFGINQSEGPSTGLLSTELISYVRLTISRIAEEKSKVYTLLLDLPPKNITKVLLNLNQD